MGIFNSSLRKMLIFSAKNQRNSKRSFLQHTWASGAHANGEAVAGWPPETGENVCTRILLDPHLLVPPAQWGVLLVLAELCTKCWFFHRDLNENAYGLFYSTNGHQEPRRIAKRWSGARPKWEITCVQGSRFHSLMQDRFRASANQ